MDKPQIGDKVRFSADFCRRVGPSAKKMRGEIVQTYFQVRPNGPFMVSVLWGGDERAKNVLTSNLAKVRGKK